MSQIAASLPLGLKELQGKGIADPTVAVVAVTNKDRKAANSHIHDLLQANNLLGADTFAKEHFDDPQLTTAQKRNAGMLSGAGVDRLVFNQDYKEKGVGRGDVIIVKGYDIEHNRILGTIEGKGIQISINPDKQMNFSPYVLDERKYSVGDKIESRAIIRGGQGRESFVIKNGKRGVVVGLDSGGAVVIRGFGLRAHHYQGSGCYISKNDHRGLRNGCEGVQPPSYLCRSNKGQGQHRDCH